MYPYNPNQGSFYQPKQQYAYPQQPQYGQPQYPQAGSFYGQGQQQGQWGNAPQQPPFYPNGQPQQQAWAQQGQPANFNPNWQGVPGAFPQNAFGSFGNVQQVFSQPPVGFQNFAAAPQASYLHQSAPSYSHTPLQNYTVVPQYSALVYTQPQAQVATTAATAVPEAADSINKGPLELYDTFLNKRNKDLSFQALNDDIKKLKDNIKKACSGNGQMKNLYHSIIIESFHKKDIQPSRELCAFMIATGNSNQLSVNQFIEYIKNEQKTASSKGLKQLDNTISKFGQHVNNADSIIDLAKICNDEDERDSMIIDFIHRANNISGVQITQLITLIENPNQRDFIIENQLSPDNGTLTEDLKLKLIGLINSESLRESYIYSNIEAKPSENIKEYMELINNLESIEEQLAKLLCTVVVHNNSNDTNLTLKIQKTLESKDFSQNYQNKLLKQYNKKLEEAEHEEELKAFRYTTINLETISLEELHNNIKKIKDTDKKEKLLKTIINSDQFKKLEPQERTSILEAITNETSDFDFCLIDTIKNAWNTWDTSMLLQIIETISNQNRKKDVQLYILNSQTFKMLPLDQQIDLLTQLPLESQTLKKFYQEKITLETRGEKVPLDWTPINEIHDALKNSEKGFSISDAVGALVFIVENLNCNKKDIMYWNKGMDFETLKNNQLMTDDIKQKIAKSQSFMQKYHAIIKFINSQQVDIIGWSNVKKLAPMGEPLAYFLNAQELQEYRTLTGDMTPLKK